jgi:hypothetical protein
MLLYGSGHWTDSWREEVEQTDDFAVNDGEDATAWPAVGCTMPAAAEHQAGASSS